MTDHMRLIALIASGKRYLASCKCGSHDCSDAEEGKRFEDSLAKAGG